MSKDKQKRNLRVNIRSEVVEAAKFWTAAVFNVLGGIWDGLSWKYIEDEYWSGRWSPVYQSNGGGEKVSGAITIEENFTETVWVGNM